VQRPRVTAGIIVACGVGLVLAYAYPGYMSYDSCLQLTQARSGELTDWHPPAMAALWRVVEVVVSGPVGMLVLQVGCVTAGAYVLVSRHLPARAAAACTSGLLVFPPVLLILATIWKDAQMAGYLLLGTALVTTSRRRAQIAGLALLALGTAMRHNAFTITLPILALGFVWDPAHGRARRVLVGVGAWLAITAAAELANLALTTQEAHPWQQSVAMMDIAGTLHYADADALAETDGMPLRGRDDLARRVDGEYHPRWMWDEIWHDGGPFKPATTDAEIAAIGHAWRTVVTDHPGAYLHARWDVYAETLALPWTPAKNPLYPSFLDISNYQLFADQLGHDAHPTWLQRQLLGAFKRVGRSWLFRPWLYLALAVALLVRARDRVVVALLASGILSELALFVAAPTPDFRYSLWLVIATLIAAMILLGQRLRGTTPST
jgi:hypothetical protein